MNKLSQTFQSLGKSPFLWGVLVSIGFYALIFRGPLNHPLVERYFAGHPVEYMETFLFFVGIASLLNKLFDVLAQRPGLAGALLEPTARPGQPAADSQTLLKQLEQLPPRRQRDYVVTRFRAALEYVQRRGSAESLGDELKYLADGDMTRAQSGYALFRVIVWAIPILGFLGTVIGITMALNSVDFQSPEQSMVHVLQGLGVKFDTTALALTLAMVLMFIHYYVEGAEMSLLERVDQRVTAELAERFPALPAGPDGQVAAVRRMAETMLQATDALVQRQTELWQATLDAAAVRWTQMANQAGEQLQKSLAAALSDSLRGFAQHLGAAEQAHLELGRRQWDELQQSQQQNLQLLGGLQMEMGRQTEVLQQALAATGEVTRLEDALNRNLTALAGAKHFEQTVLSLAAALNLLGARLAETPGAAPVKLEPSRRTVHAA